MGKITDKETGRPLAGANVLINGTSLGGAADMNGEYEISDISAGSYKVSVLYVGYAEGNTMVQIPEDGSVTQDFVLQETGFSGETVVVTASRRPEKLTKTPATVDVITSKMIDEIPVFNPGELAARLKGVDYVRTGVLGTGLNIRGFNSAFNAKNLQITDGRLSTLIATGLPLGALGTTVKEDIDHIEVVLGPASALYGPNANNGLVNIITKDPRSSQGTTVVLDAGSQSVVSGRFRHAQVVNDKFAFKISGEYSKGTEFNYVDSVYIGTTAFDEFKLDRDFNSTRSEAALYYTPKKNTDVILSAGYSNSTNLGVTNAGRNQIKDWQVYWTQLRFNSPHWYGEFYFTGSKTEDTYAINQRTQNYWSFKNAGFSEQESASRSLHEQWFAPYGISLNREANFKDNSKRLNGEVQYNNSFAGFDMVVGAQWQRDMADSKGTYLLDKNGSIDLNQTGGYAQIEHKLGDSGLKLTLAARADNHDLYGFNFIPKGGLVYSTDNGSWRLTYGKGIAAPTILNLKANLFGGLLIGNGEGFTRADGSKVAKLDVETIQTFEAGYKGILNNKLFVDVNGYYNLSENFLSPLQNVAATSPIVKVGNSPIGDILPGVTQSTFLLTYLNFGKVNSYGFDIGLNYYLNTEMNFTFNYSYFGFTLDKNDLKNDGNLDGVVNENELSLNTPTHKIGAGFNYSRAKIFATVFARWVQEYDFFSGINVAAKTNSSLIYGGSPVIEHKRVGRDFNDGPLGGFINFDIGAGYHVTDHFTTAVAISNIFDSTVREFVASPSIGRLVSAELKYAF